MNTKSYSPAIYNPITPNKTFLNKDAVLPFGVTVEHIFSAMNEFTDFLGYIDTQLVAKEMTRLEEMLMPANFSSMVGEFMTSSIPKYCSTIVKNNFHNGHPDMLPANKYQNDSAQHAGSDGIEIKASRYLNGWQGHNAEDVWLMIFAFDSGRPTDKSKGIQPKPFQFLLVAGAKLEKSDWNFSGRSESSRRTITASVMKSGHEKIMSNWIYKAPLPNKK